MVTITRICLNNSNERFYVGEKGENAPIAWFDSLEDAALVCRFLSGATLSNYFQTKAMKIMHKNGDGGGGKPDHDKDSV